MSTIAVSAVYNDDKSLPDFFRCLNTINPKPTYHVFVTNNCTDKTDELIDSYLLNNKGIRISYTLHPEFTKKMDDPYSALAVAWQRGLREVRRYMKDNPDITHALWLDSDIFVLSKDAITTAMLYNKNIVCGSYLRSFPDGTYLATTFQVNDDLVQALPDYDKRRGEYLHINKIFYVLMRPWVSSGGFMLLSRRIVLDDRVNFFPIYKTGPEGSYLKETSPEYGYQIKARSLGYETWIDGTIKLSHGIDFKHRAWRSDGNGGYVNFSYEEMDKFDNLYTEEYYSNRLKTSSDITSSKVIAEAIIEYFNPRSVIDLGCGVAMELSHLENRGIVVKGIDKSSYAKKHACISNVDLWDLSTEYIPRQRYDVALCFDCVEHISPKFEDVILENIIRCSDIAMISIPYGTNDVLHLNEQPPDYWIKAFQRKGYYFDQEATSRIKTKIINTRYWVERNLQIFRKIDSSGIKPYRGDT